MAKISNMVSMELSDEEKLDAVMPISAMGRPDFPYGLRICLCNEDLERLGIDPSEARVGAYFTFRALARITDVTTNQVEGDEDDRCRIEAQIEAMHVEDGEE